MHHAVLHQFHAVCLRLVHALLVHLGHKLLFDAQNDIIDCRQQLLHQIAVPLFQCLRHNGVVGVVEDLSCHAECLVEGIAVFRQHQLAHQFRHGDDRMGVVQLDGKLVCQVVQRAVNCLVLFQNVLERCGAEEILLFQPQLFAFPGVVVRIENTGDILCIDGLSGSLQVLLLIEQVEVECMHRLCLPEAEIADVPGLAADHRHIIRHGTNGLSLEFHQNSILVPAHRPGIAVAHPVVRHFLLESVLEVLLEQTVLVADAIAIQRQIQRCCAVQEAGSQSAQTAVAQSGIFDNFQVCQRNAQFCKSGLSLFHHIQHQQVVVNGTAHQELHGEVAGTAAALVCVHALVPVRCDCLHNGFTQRLVQLLRSCRLGVDSVQGVQNAAFQFFLIHHDFFSFFFSFMDSFTAAAFSAAFSAAFCRFFDSGLGAVSSGRRLYSSFSW